MVISSFQLPIQIRLCSREESNNFKVHQLTIITEPFFANTMNVIFATRQLMTNDQLTHVSDICLRSWFPQIIVLWHHSMKARHTLHNGSVRRTDSVFWCLESKLSHLYVLLNTSVYSRGAILSEGYSYSYVRTSFSIIMWKSLSITYQILVVYL